MTLSNDIIQKFNEAKAHDFNAINYFVNYFMANVEKQLQNLNLNQDEKTERINNCREIILQNLHTCYDASSYINRTWQDIKNAIYLNQVTIPNGSKNIVIVQKDVIRARLSVANLDLMNIPVKDRELARLFYLENKSVPTLAEMYKCSETIIYVKLRRVANIVSAQKASTSVSTGNSFLYRR